MQGLRRFIRALMPILLATIGSTGFAEQPSGEWLSFGKDMFNSKFAATETILDVNSAKTLKTDWIYQTRSNVYVFPTIKDDWLYVTDYPFTKASSIFNPRKDGGYLYALDRHTGALRWEHSIYDYSGSGVNIVSRNSPAVYEDSLIFGDAISIATVAKFYKDAKSSIYSVDRMTGKLNWKTVVEDHNGSQITQSPTVYNGVVYVGVSSLENVLPVALSVLYPCCSFRGSMLALDAKTGAILWKTYMIPKAPKQREAFSGASVWGSSPAIDVKRGLVYIATGNNYDAPKPFKQCLVSAQADPIKQNACYESYDSKDNLFDAVVALDMKTGAIKWSKKVMSYDVWNLACEAKSEADPKPNPINIACPRPEGGDDDFAQAPMLMKDVAINGRSRDIVVVGQKTGVFWAFDADNGGEVLWTTKVGPDGLFGGHEFGSATDGVRIYAQITNYEHKVIDITAGPQAGEKTNGGIWAALDPVTGRILWQTPVPGATLPLTGNLESPKWGKGLGMGFFAVAKGPMSVANGVVYAGSLDGTMVAMHAETGEILWSHKTVGSVNSAPAIVNGSLYWGSGYSIGFQDHSLYKFSPAK